jgi:phytoene dehydrogenase-like protein
MEIEALAALAGNTIVAVAVTDAFEGVRAKVARIFGRGRSDPRIQRRLDQTRQQLAASTPGELVRAQAAQARQWQTRIADLLADYPRRQGNSRRSWRNSGPPFLLRAGTLSTRSPELCTADRC